MGTGSLGVGDQHGAIDGPGTRKPGVVEHHQAVLGLVHDLQDRTVLQQRPQRLERDAGVDLLQRRRGRVGRRTIEPGGIERQLGAGGRHVAQRDITGVTGPGGEREPDEARLHRPRPIGGQSDGDRPARAGQGDPGGESAGVGDRLVGAEGRLLRPFRELGRLRRGRRRLALHAEPDGGAAEAHRVQPGHQGRSIGLLRRQVVERHRQRHVARQLHQLAADAGRVRMGDQHVAPLAGLHGRRGREHGVDGPELLDQLRCGLGADPGYARHVVDAVPHEGLDLDHLARRHAELLHHLGRTDRLLLDRVLHRHPIVDELHQVLVGGDDGGSPARGGRGAGVAGDEVVGLPGGELDGGHAECGGRIADEGELRDQLVGRVWAVRLVLAVQVVAERRAPGVEDDGDVRAFMVLQQTRQHVGEAEHGIDRRPVGATHRRQRVEGAEDEP